MSKIELKHFKPSEFRMGQVNVFDKMDTVFLMQLDKLRDNINQPISITSSYRDKEYNKQIGGVKSSFHLKGRAVDIVCPTSHYRALVMKEALNLGLSVGVMNNALHLDNRDIQVVFHYYPRYGNSLAEQTIER